ncbi:putative transcription factor/ chromatin remodeling BED-type(Zn) family [Helianthus anomalus]
MASNENVVLVLETKRTPEVWKHFDLCLMFDNTEMARCKYCKKFMKVVVNLTIIDIRKNIVRLKKQWRGSHPEPPAKNSGIV